MHSMKIYVAGSYTADSIEQIEKYVQTTIDAGTQIWKKGHFPFIPHVLHWVDLRAAELNIPMSWEDYMLWDSPWLDDCGALPLLAESKGALLELERAAEEGMKIFHSMDEIPTVERGKTWADAYTEDWPSRVRFNHHS